MRRTALAVTLLLWIALPAIALGQIAGEKPEELKGLQIVDRAGEMIPSDLSFVDETGKQVVIGDYLNQDQPLLVQFIYHKCPMLCTFVLDGYVAGAADLDWKPGSHYQVLSISIDPRDTPEEAAAKKANYIKALGAPEAAAGWHFLTGNEEAIVALTGAMGFEYRWVEEQKEFAHAAGMFAVTPEGKISRTLYGIQFSKRDLRLTLTEAGEGRLGTPFDQFLLYCFQYSGEEHKYALAARNIMKLGGLVTVLIMGGFLVMQWRRRDPSVHGLKKAQGISQ